MADKQSMGLGALGGAGLVFKRKYRWTLAIKPYCTQKDIPSNFVKLASRPNLTIEETEINYLHGKMFLPGKGTWETITVTYYDIGGASAASGMSNLYSWLASVYNFTGTAPVGGAQATNPLQNLQQSSDVGDLASKKGYGADASLTLFDGCGTIMENWAMTGAWPQAVNFGELDYSSSEEVTIELTLRYQNAVFTPGCGMDQFKVYCSGC